MYLIQPTIGNFKRVKEYFYHHNPKRSWSKEKDKLIDIKKKNPRINASQNQYRYAGVQDSNFNMTCQFTGYISCTMNQESKIEISLLFPNN